MSDNLDRARQAAELAARKREEMREARDEAQYAFEQAEEAAEDALMEAKVAASDSLAGRCFRWHFEDDGVGRDLRVVLIVSVDPAADKAITLDVSDNENPGPFSPKIQLYGTTASDIFRYSEYQREIPLEEFTRIYRRVEAKMAAALPAQGIDARSGTTGTGVIGEADESPVAESDAPTPSIGSTQGDRDG